MREREILLVEDNDNDIILTKRALTKANIKNELVIARDGVEAIDYLYGKFQKNSGDERFRRQRPYQPPAENWLPESS